MKCPKCGFGACPRAEPYSILVNEKVYRCNRCEALMDKNGKELSEQESYWYNLKQKEVRQ